MPFLEAYLTILWKEEKSLIKKELLGARICVATIDDALN